MKTIGQASKDSEITIETIRYYEREGIIPAVQRAENGRRQYTDVDISRLKFIKRFRSLGFPIADIVNLQKLAFSERNRCEEAAEIGRRNLDIVRMKIAELRQMESALNRLVSECGTSSEICPMLRELQSS